MFFASYQDFCETKLLFSKQRKKGQEDCNGLFSYTLWKRLIFIKCNGKRKESCVRKKTW